MTTNADKLFCSSCRKEILPGSNFCKYCGGKVEVHFDSTPSAEETEAPVVEHSNQNEAPVLDSKVIVVGTTEAQKSVEANSESQPEKESEAKPVKKRKKK